MMEYLDRNSIDFVDLHPSDMDIIRNDIIERPHMIAIFKKSVNDIIGELYPDGIMVDEFSILPPELKIMFNKLSQAELYENSKSPYLWKNIPNLRKGIK